MTEERPTEPAPTPAEPAPTPATPAYTPPSYTPPPVPPPAAPQPAVSWAPPPTTVVAGKRTTLSLAAGILLVILGVLGVLLSLAILTIGREFARQFDFTSLPGFEGGNPGDIVSSVITFVGILLLVFSTFYVVGGVGVIRSANWGRVIGIIIGILAGLFWLASLASPESGSRGSAPTAIVLLALHAYVAVALLFFWRNKAPA